MKQLPKTTEQRLSNNFSGETIFNETAPLYEKAPSKEVSDIKLKYNRNIMWFNSPHRKNVITKVGHYFLKLLGKHFPRHHKLHRIFDKDTVKVSYSCTKNKINHQQS